MDTLAGLSAKIKLKRPTAISKKRTTVIGIAGLDALASCLTV